MWYTWIVATNFVHQQACRMAVELGLNTYVGHLEGESEDHKRERRNRERTYLVLWVHDRALSMQTGRNWMLPEVSDIIFFTISRALY